MLKSDFVVEDIVITKDNEKMESVKVVIDQDSSELIIISSKKEEDDEKAIKWCLVGGNIFFGVLCMLCFSIDDIRLFGICMAMILGGALGLNDVLYFERKKRKSIVEVLFSENGFKNKIRELHTLIK